MTDIEEEQINKRLRRSDHVFLGRNELNNRVVEFRSLPSIYTLLCCCIPIESLWNIVREVTHITSPSMSMVEECDVGINVGSTSATTRDNLILNNRNRVI